MTLIFGGAYQGKLNYAQSVFGPGATVTMLDEHEAEPDLNDEILAGYHRLVWAQLRKNIDPYAYLQARWDVLSDKIITCDDISCGVVPVDAESRGWREAVGRCLVMLSEQADSVIRVFCGIGLKIK